MFVKISASTTRRTFPALFISVIFSASLALSFALFLALFPLPAQSQSNEVEQESENNLGELGAKNFDGDSLLGKGFPRLRPSSKAKLIGLNKRSGQARKILATVGKVASFETLAVRLVSCTRIAYPMHDDFAALLKISDRSEGILFQGWMYAEYPSLNSMEHPIYDIWVESCAP